MSWKNNLQERARRTARRKKRIYGIEPPPRLERLLDQEPGTFRFPDIYRLNAYIFLKSPRRRLKLLWQYILDRDTPVRRKKIDLLEQKLRPRLSADGRVRSSFFERKNCSRDLARVPVLMETMLHRTTPFLVVQPGNERDIAKVLAFARAGKMAVFPRGSASFAFGGAVPTRNGIVIDMSPMMAVLEIDQKQKTVRVQPGARWSDVAAKLEPYGLIPATTPTSRFSTVAGWISTGGLGLDSFGYGSVHGSVLKVRVARADGTIEEIDDTSDSIRDILGTEGQFGILTEITLRVRPKPDHSGAHLVFFDAPFEAMGFIERLSRQEILPSHVAYFDPEYLRNENLLFAEFTGMEGPIVSERDAVLLHFETPEQERGFLAWQSGEAGRLSEDGTAARYLWAERYFPLRAQRIGPGLLGAEAVLPGNKVAPYITRIRKLTRHFHVKPAIEVIAGRNENEITYLVIISFSCDYTRSLHYILSLMLIQLLVRLAVLLGGAPYGIGIWNTSFIGSRYGKARLAELKAKKRALDAEDTLNPNKFFKVKGRYFSIPALFMRPLPFRLILGAAHLFAPLIGLTARLLAPKKLTTWEVPSKDTQKGKNLLHQSSQRCTSCGACIPVCPAYHITRDELVAGRTKLRMTEAIMNGWDLDQAEAFSPFQCLHCGLCEEVCQTHLPLRECYLVLEEWIEERYGRPVERLQGFIEKLDENREYIEDVFGLTLPEWSPGDPPTEVPRVEPPQKGEGT